MTYIIGKPTIEFEKNEPKDYDEYFAKIIEALEKGETEDEQATDEQE